MGVVKENAPESNWLEILFALTIFNIGWIALYGFQTAHIEILVAGVVLIPLAYFADRLSRGHIFRSKASFGLMALSAMIPIFFVEVIGFVSNLQFSFYQASSETYFSTVLEAAPPDLQDAFNFFYAPVVENFVGLAVTIFSYRVLKGFFQGIQVTSSIGPVLAALIAPLPAAWLLSSIHTTAGPEFKIIALIAFYLMIVPIFLEDVTGFRLFPIIPVTMGTLHGIHWAINGSQLGGFYALMAGFWANSSDISWTFNLIVLFFVVNILASLWYLWGKTGGRALSIRSLTIQLIKSVVTVARSILPI